MLWCLAVMKGIWRSLGDTAAVFNRREEGVCYVIRVMWRRG